MGAGTQDRQCTVMTFLVAWMAPEIIEDPSSFSPAADVYSFAMVLWEMSTGESPNQGTPNYLLV